MRRLETSKMPKHSRRYTKGFFLIELLVVVAIILIIAAIAIPNLLRSKMAANEASAVATLRTLTTAAFPVLDHLRRLSAHPGVSWAGCYRWHRADLRRTA